MNSQHWGLFVCFLMYFRNSNRQLRLRLDYSQLYRNGVGSGGKFYPRRTRYCPDVSTIDTLTQDFLILLVM